MKTIPLTQGKFAIVDDADYDFLMQWKWLFAKGYAMRNGPRNNYARDRIYMHRLLAGNPNGMEVDHVNLDKLDNRRSNLRACTHQQNCCNTPLSKRNKSGFKGVSFDKKAGKFMAMIKIGPAKKFLGYFHDPKVASSAYVKAAIENRGEFARCH